MIRYNRLTSSHMDLYLRGLVLEPRTTYELRMDIYGGPINIFLTSYNIVQGAGSHYVDYNEVWTPHKFSFTTGDNLEEISQFAEWGIAFVKKQGERLPTDADDTYIDNVRLVRADEPRGSLIEGGDFESPKPHPVYDANWRREVLGLAGEAYGVDIVPDPCGGDNHCLRLPRPHEEFYDVSLQPRPSTFGCIESNQNDVSFSKFKNETTHLLLLVIHGHITAQTKDATVTATDGQLLYFPPHEAGQFTCRSGRGVLYYQLSFSENPTSTLLADIGFHKLSAITLRDTTVLGNIVNTMLQYSPKSRTYLYAVNGQLLIFLAELDHQLHIDIPRREKYTPFIEELAEKLRRAPETPLSTAEAAAECGVSESYFITLFKRKTGFSPYQYRLRELINKACLLLQDTTMTIQEISYTLGIDDPLYFSRLFRSYRGISPTTYRKHLNT